MVAPANHHPSRDVSTGGTVEAGAGSATPPAEAAWPSAPPHLLQKRAPVSGVAPHVGQGAFPSAAPQLEQKLPLAGAPHSGQTAPVNVVVP